MKNLKKIIVFIIFLTVTTIFSQVYAQTNLPLVVYPARNQIEVEPGEKQVLTITFYNQSGEPISGYFKVADFIVDNTIGEPKLIDDINLVPPKYAASNWIKLLYDRATLPANEKMDLQIRINVPKDANPGGKYAAVFFQTSETLPNKSQSEEQKGTGTALRIASLLYIKVKGPIKEKALITRFFTPYFLEYGPIKIDLNIFNRGDYHITPKGLLTLTNILNKPIDQQLLPERNIFPDSQRNYQIELGKKWMIGKYKINLEASYGETGQALTSSLYVWVFPWRIALIILLTLIIIILLIKHFYNEFIKKEYNLEKELEKERQEIEELKRILRKKQE